MTKKHEELVEEITRRIRSVMVRYAKWEAQGLLRATNQEMARGVAKEVIALILSAVRDGLSFELIEEMAALEHEQWMEWSKHVADEVSPERRARWEAYWVPYEQLSEEVKEHDRVWARKIIALSGTDKEEQA